MKVVIVLLALVTITFCATGVDVSQAVSASSFQCLKNAGYSYAIVRCYESGGSVDPNCASNVANAHSAGMGSVDIYVFPCFKCGNPSNQISAVVNYVKQHSVNYGTMWLDIEGTQYWGSTSENVQFFQGLVSAARSSGVKLGVYTSASQWTPIMGSSTSGSSYPLWYAHYDGQQSFNDFSAFGGWSKPSMKQYNGNVATCSAGIDENWIPGSAPSTGGSSTSGSNGPSNSNGPSSSTRTAGPSSSNGPSSSTRTAGPSSSNGPSNSNGPSSSGKTHSGSSTRTADSSSTRTSSGPSSTTQTSSSTQYSSGGTAGSSSNDFKFNDAIYNKLGGHKSASVRNEQERARGTGDELEISEVDDEVIRDSHFKVVEEKAFNKFFDNKRKN